MLRHEDGQSPVTSETADIVRPPSAHMDDHDWEKLPVELKTGCRHVAWCWQWRSKWTKPPIDPETGDEIDATDPDNWLDPDEARERARRHGDGIGYALGTRENPSGLIPVDWDSCIAPDGTIDPFVDHWIRRLDSYTERTPGGTGL